MVDKIPAAVDRALGELEDKISGVDQSEDIAKVDAKVDDHKSEIDSLKLQIEKLWLHIKHFLPAEGPELPDHLKD